MSEREPSQEEIDKAEAERRRESGREREREAKEFERMKEVSRVESRHAVRVCVSTVRQQLDARTYKGSSRFDAYVTGEYGEHFHLLRNRGGKISLHQMLGGTRHFA